MGLVHHATNANINYEVMYIISENFVLHVVLASNFPSLFNHFRSSIASRNQIQMKLNLDRQVFRMYSARKCC